ncbi:MAG: dihydroorotate dehydrogenase-like protein [Candidatus Latescibacteria bacterium]|jgi:dihydroorotate dehydrogenase (fumarate)|nr:dihydroorotate dehydrogenase-like protein [Candidatus Latescibacterota bacterium]MBT5828997.1 dihydroorotate dehydrogenase-like protein [Candidatus Latescibacterota bacterium]
MDLRTTYMNMELKNPIVASASPLSREVANVRAMEDAGIAAVVMYSLFEEQISHETAEVDHYLSQGTGSFAEALDFFPEPEIYHRGPDEYLEHIRRLKDAVDIPVIASLNGVSPGGWTEYAQLMVDAGADALELNVYHIATDPTVSGAQVEQLYVDVLSEVKRLVKIPVAIKLSPFFSSMAGMAKQLDNVGADALVLFNRFYQPDFDLEELDVVSNVILSTPMAARLPLRWIAILHGRVSADLAATSGVHEAEDVIKMLMAGASVTMVCSTLLKNGIGHAWRVLDDMNTWLEEREYVSVSQLQGSMSQAACSNPEAYERANYMRALNTFEM